MTGAGSIKAHIFAAALAALAMAPGICFGQISGDQGPVKPGSVRVTTRAPEPGKWDLASAGAQAEAVSKQAADILLANTVIENYRVEVVG